ncbi:hypothetical protein C8R46DRAFT_1211919 [Mycena filopes]|nr:hypothetical protein C8R46DRAFT_1211919 [Mycena filopes]
MPDAVTPSLTILIRASMQPRELALRTLRANQEHQYALAQHAGKLTADLAELDKLISQAGTEDGESELESDFYIPNSKPPVGAIRNFIHPESPFYQDAMKRTRYLNFTIRHTMTAKEVEALKGAVDAELRRVEQLEGASSTTTDAQMVDKLNWTVIAEKVSDSSATKRTAEECKIKWMSDVSSVINRTAWSAVESQALHKIVKIKSREQAPVNWVEVAQELGTNRLPLECMRHNQDRRTHIWNTELDQKVVDAVRQYGHAWSLVAKYVSPHLTPSQCSNRYLRTLDPTLRRGAWSPEEDKRLTAAVAGYGKSWSEVASVVPGRTNEQCRDRWIGILDPSNLKKEEWDSEDEEVLLQCVRTMGRKWKPIAAKMNRTPANVGTSLPPLGCWGYKFTQCRIHYDSLRIEVREKSDDDETPEPPTPKPRARKPRAKKVELQLAIDGEEGAVAEEQKDGIEPMDVDKPPPRPRPKPLAKTKSTGRGSKRSAPDPDAEFAPTPRKKRAVTNPEDSDTEDETAQNPDATTDTPSPPKKGKGRAPQAVELPRRRSARFKTEP